MSFSERNGHVAARTVLQLDSIDEPLKNSLWNALQIFIWDRYSYEGLSAQTSRSGLNNFFRSLWLDFFVTPVDTIPFGTREAVSSVRKYFFKCDWFKIYDLIEFVIPILPSNKDEFIAHCNKVLERAMAGYRLVGDRITPVTNSAEIQAVEGALTPAKTPANPTCNAHIHIQHALDLLSKKPTPDYRNSIKESISAVESAVKHLASDPSATLGSALSKFSKQHSIHPSFEKGIKALYGYTSDAGGIRHALMDQSSSTSADAKFMLVICSAFVNYLLELSTQTQQHQS